MGQTSSGIEKALLSPPAETRLRPQTEIPDHGAHSVSTISRALGHAIDVNTGLP